MTWSSQAGAFRVRGTPGAAEDHPGIAFGAFTAHDLPDGVEPNLDADHSDPHDFSFPLGTHLCAVEVDTETGMVESARTSRSTTSARRSTR